MNCLNQINPSGGFCGQHETSCANKHLHSDGEIALKCAATHHALFGVSREHPHGSACMNVCGSCASKAEKKGAIVTKGIVE